MVAGGCLGLYKLKKTFEDVIFSFGNHYPVFSLIYIEKSTYNHQ